MRKVGRRQYPGVQYQEYFFTQDVRRRAVLVLEAIPKILPGLETCALGRAHTPLDDKASPWRVSETPPFPFPFPFSLR